MTSYQGVTKGCFKENPEKGAGDIKHLPMLQPLHLLTQYSDWETLYSKIKRVYGKLQPILLLLHTVFLLRGSHLQPPTTFDKDKKDLLQLSNCFIIFGKTDSF